MQTVADNPPSANLAQAGHSVFLIEAGGNQGNTPLQRIPAMADQVAKHPSMSWSFYVNHYQNETQARRDSKYAYRLSNSTLWSGLDPPEGSEPPTYGEGAAPISLLYRSSVSETNDTDLYLFGAAGTVFRGYFPGYSTWQAPPTSWFWSIVKMQPGNQAGTITLRSKDPRQAPEINFNYFVEKGDRDLQAIQEGVEHAMRIFNATGEPYAPFKVVEPRPSVSIRG
ncbi:Choline dehydrogenase [Fusarium agapanthi]|uniref:Choline dehydrogenase n=1 Tax=Fusarium agapanthi TaxID=1803897 RepID=A0A9P5B1Q7_9HYPO|nr:Choline dehydrogenase [Fusarium agapanthi]